MSNLLLALREGDFSFRARGARQRDPLGDVLAEINGLGDILQTQRRGALEATALLSAVIKEIDVAIFAFDARRSRFASSIPPARFSSGSRPSASSGGTPARSASPSALRASPTVS